MVGNTKKQNKKYTYVLSHPLETNSCGLNGWFAMQKTRSVCPSTLLGLKLLLSKDVTCKVFSSYSLMCPLSRPKVKCQNI